MKSSMHREFCRLDTLLQFRPVRFDYRGPITLFPFVSHGITNPWESTAVGTRLGCRLPLRPKHLGNCLNRDGPQIAYVIPDSGFQFRQNSVQFVLSAGGDGPIS